MNEYNNISLSRFESMLKTNNVFFFDSNEFEDIIDYYLDYSYLKKRLENLNLIHSIKDNEFMRILYEEMELISKKDYEEYSIKNKLSSLNKSSSTNRENNFNNIFD